MTTSEDNTAEKAWTQGQVRETFVRGREQHTDFPGINNARKEFESWLATHDAEQREAGRLAALEEAAALVVQYGAEKYPLNDIKLALRALAEGTPERDEA